MKTPRLVIARVLAGRLGERKLPLEIAAYLLSEKRAGELDSLLRDMQQFRADDSGIIEAEAVSAYPLSAAVKEDIRRRLKTAFPAAKQIIITERRDPDLIGGVRLNLANQQLDLSVRAKLNHFKQRSSVHGTV